MYSHRCRRIATAFLALATISLTGLASAANFGLSTTRIHLDAAHPVETLSRDRLLDAVWGYENYPTTRTVDTHIVHLRQKLEPNPEEPRFILTVHGSGYKFVG